MSQELLFLLFMIFEGVFLIGLYQFYLVPKVISPAVVEHWLAFGQVGDEQVADRAAGDRVLVDELRR